MNRRTFLGGAAGLAIAGSTAKAATMPVIDTHIHLFDTERPQGVPWPDKGNAKLYKPALPARYRKLSAPFGIVGAIEVECSTWLEDNQWVLDVAAKDTIIVGTVGNLEPGKPEFGKHLDRFHANPLFRGIRYGNLWGRNLGNELSNPQFVSDLKALAAAGLVLDTANPRPELVAAALKTTDLVPNLRVVMDHMPQLTKPSDAKALASYMDTLREIGKRPQVYVKISGVVRRVDGKVPLELAFYRDRIDELLGIFGEDRLLFGSDWPNSDQWADYPQVFNLVNEYFTAKGTAIAEKYFWKNSVAAYKWVKRDASQPTLLKG